MRFAPFACLAVVGLVGCPSKPTPVQPTGPHAASQAQPSEAEAAQTDPGRGLEHVEARGRFAGMKVGQEFHHGASPTVGAITLAPGLERLSTVSFADGWVFISAREGADLVVLLANEGVITDDVTMPGFADHLIVADCDTTADTFLAVLAPDGCTDTNAPRSVRGFTHDGRRLVDVPDPVTCWCDFVDP